MATSRQQPNIAYKVVTQDLRSLGLKRNPTILTFPIGEWVYENGLLRRTKEDRGGIWVARTMGNARHLAKYMRNKRDTETRIFRSEIGERLYENSYRVKTDKVRMLEELI